MTHLLLPGMLNQQSAGGGSISYVGAGTHTEAYSTDTISPPLPGGISTNDLLVACIGISDDGAISPPTGWTEADQDGSLSGSDRQVGIFYHLHDGGGTPSFTLGVSEPFLCGRVIAFSGVDTGTPALSTGGNGVNTDNDNTPPNFAGTAPTPSSGDVMVAALMTAGAGIVSGGSAPSGMTLVQIDGDTNSYLCIAYEILSGTPTPQDWTLTDASTGTESSGVIGIFQVA